VASIAIEKVKRSYGATAVLKEVNLNVADGEFISLLGPSGCGKSTLLRLIAGLDFPDQGKILLDDKDITGLAARARDIAMVFQNYALYPHMTTEQNIAVPLEQRQLSSAQRLPVIGQLFPEARRIKQGIAEQVRRAAAATSIEHLLDRRPSQLSGGQRQRVALARAIVRNPKAFLFDEPLSNLDAHLRVQVRDEIASLHQKLGTTFIYVTHDQEEAMALSDRIALMKDGAILQIATPEELYSRPASVDVAMFIGQPQMNLLGGRIDGDGQLTIEGVPQPIWISGRRNEDCHVGVRPTEFTVTTAARASSIRTVMQQRQYIGGAELWNLTTPYGTPVKAHVPDRIAKEASKEIFLNVGGQDVHVFSKDGRRVASELATADERPQPVVG
jgi:multiple sugar transport system ATP-binding protein